MVNTYSTNQKWEVGETVKVGFMRLVVKGIHADPERGPDIYTLTSTDGSRLYEFQPHRGLSRIRAS